ncbi:hypothetical protein ACFWP3_23545 [Streptomyces sp. NPDC058525]|uniref:hypothetical protein n=1 Tax=Streptomyces sp. NPDC058525 TaxID=3346538 RepID=UPI00365C6CF4
MAMNNHYPSDPANGEEIEFLACGRDLAAVWEHAGESGADAHTHQCGYCQEALADLERLRAAALPPETASAAALDTSALVRRVMDVVRLELRPGQTLPG